MIKSRENSFGAWAFLVGVIFAVAIGVISVFIPTSTITAYSPHIYGILVLMGLIIGISINVEGKDSQTFLIAGAIIVIVSQFGKESVYGNLIGIGLINRVPTIFGAFLALFVPATIIVALKTLFSVTKI